MRRLFRWFFGKAIWFCVALVVSALGVYFAYGVAGGELSYNATVAIIMATAVGATVVSECVVSAVRSKKSPDTTHDKGEK